MHHFYTLRNLWVLGGLYEAVRSATRNLCNISTFFVQYASLGFSKLSRYVPTHYSQVNQYLSGTLYVGSQQVEVSPEYILRGKLSRMTKRELKRHVSTPNLLGAVDTTATALSSESCDYIFTDPPFGGNLMYSELNFLWEAWLKVFTNNKKRPSRTKSRARDCRNTSA